MLLCRALAYAPTRHVTSLSLRSARRLSRFDHLTLVSARTMSGVTTHSSLKAVSVPGMLFSNSLFHILLQNISNYTCDAIRPKSLCVAPLDAPAAIGPYSQAIAAGDLLFVSGCIPLVPSSMEIIEGGVVEQTKQALANFKAVVEGAGGELGKVVKTTVCLPSVLDLSAFQPVDIISLLSLRVFKRMDTHGFGYDRCS
jgi:reactive intermediate/imine deaminase